MENHHNIPITHHALHKADVGDGFVVEGLAEAVGVESVGEDVTFGLEHQALAIVLVECLIDGGAMESFNDIISGDGLTLVDFFATWCGPCKMMHPVLEQLKGQMGDSIRTIKVDIDRNSDAAQKYNVRSVPTLMLFRNGSLLWRQSGAVPLTSLLAAIGQYRKGMNCLRQLLRYRKVHIP